MYSHYFFHLISYLIGGEDGGFLLLQPMYECEKRYSVVARDLEDEAMKRNIVHESVQ